MKKRKVCVVTGARSEYGLLRWVMDGVRRASDLELQVVVTGSHLSPAHGLTVNEIVQDGFEISRRVEVQLSSDTGVGMAKSMGLGLIGFADAFADLRPDVVVVLGDRYELLAVASAALACKIPLAHLHGGELTEGAIDEAIRHAVTKLSLLHFVAAAEYGERVMAMGEEPERVFVVGGLGVDNILRLPVLTRAELEASMDFRFGARNLLVTFHPETLSPRSPEQQVAGLLEALRSFPDIHLVFTLPNADAGGHVIRAQIERFVSERSNACVHASLGQKRYLSCLRVVDGVVGNSSSALLEAPTLKKGAINIGERQAGRLRAESVLDCANNPEAIRLAISQLYTPQFEAKVAGAVNPYGDGGASERVVEVLRSWDFDRGIRKRFFTSRHPSAR